jgi:transcription factor SPN1
LDINKCKKKTAMSKEEREQRDLDQCPKRRRTSDFEGGEGSSKEDMAFRSDPSKSLRPGDPGWVPRARVPMPSTKDYVVRPKWKVDTEISRVSLLRITSRLTYIVINFICRHLGNK